MYLGSYMQTIKLKFIQVGFYRYVNIGFIGRHFYNVFRVLHANNQIEIHTGGFFTGVLI